MNAKGFFPGLCILGCCLLILCSCEKHASESKTQFTKADSVTGTYLLLRDSMLHVWNTMIHDDNRKIKAMYNLLHELAVSNPEKRDELASFEERLDQLKTVRYDQKSISNTDIVAEYDFASNALVSELISMAELQSEFAYNTTLQKLVETIRSADQRVNNYRAEYDHIAARYNRFIEKNQSLLKEFNEDSFLEKKPLFQVATE